MNPKTAFQAAFDAAERGWYVDGLALLRPALPALVAALDVEAMVLAWRLCGRLGLHGHCRHFARQLRRLGEHSLRALTCELFDRCSRGRLLDVFDRLQRPAPPPQNPREAMQWQLLRARLCTELRDFDHAEQALAAARAIDADPETVVAETAWLLHAKDQQQAALQACRDGCARFPDDVGLRELEAWLLFEHGDAAAMSTMAAVVDSVQSPQLQVALAELRFEQGDAGPARAGLERVLAAMPLERRRAAQLHLSLVRICRALGDDAAALRHATAAGPAGEPWQKRLQAALAGELADTRRVVRGVPFVRQDHLTCSPATMACLLRHHGVDKDQLEIAGQITYDGTASHRELAWATANGLCVWFFQFDPEVARRLIDLDLPFAISTRYETNGHRQALVGYDAVLDTFVLRDPGSNLRPEYKAEWLTKHSEVRGGDCALILPQQLAARVPQEVLPLCRETMALLHMRAAFDERRLPAAEALGQQLLQLPPCSLRREAELRLCGEHGDQRRVLQVYQEAHQEHPTDGYWTYHCALELQHQGRWREYREFLEQHTAAGRAPFLLLQLADDLRHHAGRRAEAEGLLRKVARWLPRHAGAVRNLARVLWADPPRRELAVEHFRLAACLDRHDEGLAGEYFEACQHLGHAESALAFLEARAHLYGASSAAPACTLARALELQHKTDAALSVLRAAVQQKDSPPASRMLFELLLEHGLYDDAASLLAAAHRFYPPDLQRARYRLARALGRHDEAMQALQASIAIDAGNAEAQRLRLELLLERQGAATAIAAADQLAQQQAADPRVLVQVAEFFERVEDRDRTAMLLQRLVQEHPQEYWLQGRLCRHYLTCGQPDLAMPLLQQLQLSSPDSTAVWVDLADARAQLGDIAAAGEAARRALELEPENGAALLRLLRWAQDAEAAAADLRLCMRLLAARPMPPQAALLDFLLAHLARLPDAEVDAFLQQLQQAFPDAPGPSTARVRFLREDHPEQALLVAEQLVARMPWVDEHWLLQANCLRRCNRRPDERLLLEQLLQKEPACAQAWVELGESWEQEGRTGKARAAFERGLQVAPGSAVLHGCLADLLWRLGERDAALPLVARATELDRGYTWAFHAHIRWLFELDQPDAALAVAEQLVATNPQWGPAHELHAQALSAVGRHDDRLAALHKAVAIEPRLGNARRKLVAALTELKRFDAAREVVQQGLQRLGDEPELHLLSSWIDRTAGDLPGSRRRLRELLDEHPDFEEGWHRYLSFCEEEGQLDAILALQAEPPACLADSAVLRAYAADAQWQRRRREPALELLRQALQLDPGYDYARDRLAELLLELQRPRQVLEVLADHQEPDALPFHRAALVARAAAMDHKPDLASACFRRLLREPDADGQVLGDVDKELRSRRRRQHEAQLRLWLQQEPPESELRQNHLRLLARRGKVRAFVRGLSALDAALPAARREAVLSRALYHGQVLQGRAVADWARAHFRPPINDVEAWGRLVFALSNDRHSSAVLLELCGADWRRPGVKGWMLANVAGAYHELGRYDEMAAVAEHALQHIAHDHSYWWHRRFLAEAALRAGDLPRCLELCAMATEEFPTVKVKVTALRLVAQIRGGRWWQRWRTLHRGLPELFSQYDLACAERRAATTPKSLLPRLLFTAAPGLTTLLLCCGKGGVALARR